MTSLKCSELQVAGVHNVALEILICVDRWAQTFEKSAAGLVWANYVIDKVQRRDGTGLVWSRWERTGGEGKGWGGGDEKELGDRNAAFIKFPLLKAFAM